jgi:hypothetical protein
MTARIGAPKTGGHRRGSLDKGERQLVTAEMAADLLTVYKKLGGVKWLLEFARANPAEFLLQGLNRLLPAAPKDDEPGDTYNTQVNFLSEIEAALRVSFMLAKAVYSDPSLAPIEAEASAPQEEVTRWPPWVPPSDKPDMPDPLLKPEPVEDVDRQRWASEIPLTPDQRRDALLVCGKPVKATLRITKGAVPSKEVMARPIAPPIGWTPEPRNATAHWRAGENNCCDRRRPIRLISAPMPTPSK